jgi:DNA-binding CsgD family transcriptional regulator
MDTALAAPSGPLGDDNADNLVNVGVEPAFITDYLRSRTRYDTSLQPLVDPLRVHCAIDHDAAMGAAWRRAAFHREIIEPLGITAVATAVLVFRGKATCKLCFNRNRGSPAFRPRDIERLRMAAPAAAIADVAVAAWCSERAQPPGRLDALSPRERDVATLVCKGLHNKEIAAALGTSVDTVRKQTMGIYGKLGVSGRVQLAVLLAASPDRRTR